MKRSDLVRSIQVQFQRLRARDADVILGALAGYMVESVAAGDKIEIRGFGTFLPRVRAGRNTINPRTGRPVILPASKAILFKPSRELIKGMN